MQKANGNCGFNHRGAVYGDYVNGIALFFLRVGKSWMAVVTGYHQTGGRTLREAHDNAARDALAWKNGTRPDRRLSRDQFEAVMAGREKYYKF